MIDTPENRWTPAFDEGVRILFVDDDQNLAELAKARLSTSTVTVETTFDGADAWERLQQEAFDVVLLDIETPTLDGFALLEKLRADARFANLPVVMLTGREDIASIDRAFQLGANSFVAKPINWRQLSYALRYVLRSARMEADLLRERKRSQELLQLTNNLLSLIRLEARTPLSAIFGFCDCIRQQIDGPIGVESYLTYAEQIDAAAQQLQDNFMDLIQYAQLASGAADLTDDEYLASKVMDAATAEFSSETARRNVPVDVAKPRENFYLLCDLHWLARALRHLLEIAMSGAGVERVGFALRRTTEGQAKFVISAFRAASAVNATDAQPASKTKSPESVRQGMGVGIPFARRIIELHDGDLVISSHDGASMMEIVIPASRVLAPPQDRHTIEAA